MRPYFSNYKPIGDVGIDPRWRDPRAGRYFHQLAPVARLNTPQGLLTDLIRAQIDAYTVSTDYNPTFALSKAADKADFDAARNRLNGQLKLFASTLGETIVVPAQSDKTAQGHTSLTTQQILDAMR